MASETRIGEYELITRIAHGGMAEIFLARRRGPAGFDKRVVIKRVLPHLAENEDFVKMFLDEARLASRLSHPNIVQIFDFGVVEGTYFLCMEHLDGEDLGTILKVLSNRGGRMPVEVAAGVLSAACDGMHYAHEYRDEDGHLLGVVHRDLSPSNLFLTFQGAVKILDFGVAKMAGKLSETQSGVVKGKFAYLSPEQALGDPVDRRSDVFALGIILYEALSGTKVFKRATDAATLRAVLEEPVESPRLLRGDLPEALERIVMKALARAPEDRWQSAQEMRSALDAFLAERGAAPVAAQVQAFMQTFRGLKEAFEVAPTPTAGGLGAVLPPATEARARERARGDSMAATAVDLPPPSALPPRSSDARPATAAEAPPSRPVGALGWVALACVLLASGVWWWSGHRGDGSMGPAPSSPGSGGQGGTEDGTPAQVQDTPAREAGAGAGEAVAGDREALGGVAKTAGGVPHAQAGSAAAHEAVARAGARMGASGHKGPLRRRQRTPARKPRRSQRTMPARATARLDVNCRPWCQIYLDGKDTGRISPAVGIAVTPGRHRLRVVNPDTGLTRERDVSAEAGQSTRIFIEF